MKWLLLSTFLLSVVAAQAQTTPPSNSDQLATYRYCVLVVGGKYFSGPQGLYLDYGQGLPSATADVEMEQLVATLKKTSVVGILNSLGQHHWELVNTLLVPTEVRGSSLDRETFLELETRYVFRRRTP
ncbi:MAG: hypothetical protein EOO63_10915 [Hymenobacter sp.]|nr:MAG: hypothetical protein EOO63_10915 [Hymenobacter sp.]